jgi:hypothetical protein
MCIESCNQVFIGWEEVKQELETKMLPQITQVPAGSRLQLINIGVGRTTWVMRVVTPNGSQFADVWIGVDPLAGWSWDGLVRIGPSTAPARVWATLQRYSDSSYRLMR